MHKTVRTKVEGDMQQLKKQHNRLVQQTDKHLFHLKYQYSVCSDHCKNHEMWLHIDFVENCIGKEGLREVQSTHFGDAHSQITLHDGHAYLAGRERISFCTMSNDDSHGPSAIWSHLLPVLQDLKTSYPEVTHLHFMSDGPVTQYPGRSNMHLLANIPFDLGFQEVWWNFSEARHRKGAADGIGSVVKQTADGIVLSDEAINDSRTLVGKISGHTSVKMYHIADAAAIPLLDTVSEIPGITTVHQIGCTKCTAKKSKEEYPCNMSAVISSQVQNYVTGMHH